MDTIAVDLTVDLKEFALQRTAEQGLPNVSQYVRELIQADRLQAAKQAIESEVIKGLRSGDSSPLSEASWQEMRTEIIRRHSPSASNS